MRRFPRLAHESREQYRRLVHRLHAEFFDHVMMRSLRLFAVEDPLTTLIWCQTLTRWLACVRHKLFDRREITLQRRDPADPGNSHPYTSHDLLIRMKRQG